jgi:hypothetical protein
MEGKFLISAVDPAGVPWDVCVTDHGDSALDILKGLREISTGRRIYWVELSDNPEAGDVEIDIEDGEFG